MKAEVVKEIVSKPLEKISEAGSIASFYGFCPVTAPRVSTGDTLAAKDLDERFRPAEKIATLREYIQNKASLPLPIMIFYEHAHRSNRIECELIILGSQRSISEAILLQTSRAILENAGYNGISARLNSVGTKENIAEFERRLLAYAKKKMTEMPSDLKQSLKKDIFDLVRTGEEKYKEWAVSAPQSVDYLSEQSRMHLKEILELMEAIDLPYSMDPALIGDPQYSTEAVFELGSDLSDTAALGSIMRWSRLSRKAELKREMPAVSASISAKTSRVSKPIRLKPLKPKFHLVQFGPEAKHKSFIVLERLRRANIPVVHSLARDKLLSQISLVEQGNIPYIILIGQKEAIDNVVVIRSTETRVQFTVPILELGEFIKKSLNFK